MQSEKSEDESRRNEARDTLEKQYPILVYFKYDHLPPHLQVRSKPFADLAYDMVLQIETTAFAEMAAGLRKLLEAKDCFVRAALTVSRKP